MIIVLIGTKNIFWGACSYEKVSIISSLCRIAGYVSDRLRRQFKHGWQQQFNTADNYISDLVVEAQPVDPLEYTGPVDKLPDDNAVGKEVKAALKKEGIENGYISISIDKNGHADPSNYAQWSETEDSSLVGQYPDPPKTVDKALDITLGKKA